MTLNFTKTPHRVVLVTGPSGAGRELFQALSFPSRIPAKDEPLEISPCSTPHLVSSPNSVQAAR